MQEENEKRREMMELALLRKEKEDFEKEMKKMKKELSLQLKNGVGDDIKNTLIKENKKENKFKRFIKKISEICH